MGRSGSQPPYGLHDLSRWCNLPHVAHGPSFPEDSKPKNPHQLRLF
jgi:hypothetical protein